MVAHRWSEAGLQRLNVVTHLAQAYGLASTNTSQGPQSVPLGIVTGMACGHRPRLLGLAVQSCGLRNVDSLIPKGGRGGRVQGGMAWGCPFTPLVQDGTCL